jgi:DNA helicase-2/ATP-dependent DNA helicase PcrA
MKLNPQQEEVANHVEGRILTLAGPGSGKTRTLTERTGRLIRRGIDPASILCLTFTNKARDEMRERITVSHGEPADKVFISNFHGLCGMILRRFGKPLGYSERLTVCDSDDQVDLLMQIARKKGMEPTKPQARTLAFIANDWRENLGDRADLLKIADKRCDRAELAIVSSYLDVLRTRNQTDFSGMLSETVRLLRECPDVREKLQKRFRFIQVDEYQDTNRAQNEIVELIADKDDNILAVGDGDQSIYEWRGASPDAIPRFIRTGESKTGKCRVVKLGLNYRSTPDIIAVADKLVRHCAGRIPVEFSTPNKPGEPVKCAAFGKPEEEAEAIATNIEKMVRQESVPPREIAVFYRANDMSRLIEQSLAKRKLPFLVVGSGSYYDRMEVKDVISMLRFVCNPKDGISFHRVANKPARGMGDAVVGRLEAFAEREDTDMLTAMRRAIDIRDENGKELSEAAIAALRETLRVFDVALERRSVAEVANELLNRTRYDEWLKDRYEEKGEYEARRANVNELVNSIAAFCEKYHTATIADYLQSISLYTDSDKNKDENAVRLMSLHASKGLEFDVVYIIGVEHNILPHEKAIKDRADRGLDEERRLCYVGFTRARKLLRVTWCRMRQDVFSRGPTAKFKPSQPSRFLMEAGLLSAEEFGKAVDATKPLAMAKSRARPAQR